MKLRWNLRSSIPPVESNPMTTQSNSSDNQPTPSTHRKRVLVVDDDPEIAESLRYALAGQGYEVLIARDGNQGLALAETEKPDLAILDLMMPRRSGFLVLEKLRENETAPPSVIVITANEGERHQDYAELLGVDEYIRKPFPMPRLSECVKNLLEKNA